MSTDVFISYKTEDKATAERLCAELEAQKISCWIAPRDIGVGKEWAEAIVEGLQQCRAFVVILSTNSTNAHQMSREAELADRQGMPIITFRIEDVQPPPGLLYFLDNVQWLDAFGNQFDSAVARLAEVLRSAVVGSEAREAGASRVRSKATTEAQSAGTRSSPEPAAVPASHASTRTSPLVWIGVAAAVAITIIAILLLRPKHESRPDVSAVRAAAEKFVRERDAGDLQTAWQNFSETAKRHQDQAAWMGNVRNAVAQFGPVQSHTFEGCQPRDNGRYLCSFVLHYRTGNSAANEMVMEKNPDGSWAVLSTKRSVPNR